MKLLKNREVQLSIAVILLMTVVYGAVSIYIMKSFTKSVNQTQIKQNIAVMGSIVKKYPELETDIVKNYTKGFEGNYEYGRSILEKYSYDENTGTDSNSSIQKDLKKVYFRLQSAVILLAIFLTVFFLFSFNRIFRKIRKLSTNAEAAVEGNYEPISGDNEEGDIGFLINQFNLMAERLNENVQTLNNEKVFLKRLITDISHQLKTPLASLIMFNDIMKNDESLSEHDRATFVSESKNQLDRIEWLIKNMLKMAKLESGVVDFDKQDAFVADTLRNSISGLKSIAAQKNIAVKFIGDNNIRVRHDIGWTTEALSNIIKNCMEHSNSGGEINITLDENNVFVQIVIQDYGAGIPKSELPRIFDRFYKGINSSSPTNIGIGLYITKTIIEGQGGSVYASSTEGNGTRFEVRIMKTV